MPFGETVLAWRTFREMTQAELAARAGVPRSNLSDMERGRREVTLGTLRALAAALSVRPGVLADGVGPEPGGKDLSRDVLERIAKGAVRDAPLSDPWEKATALRLRSVLAPRLGASRLPARGSDRAWVSLKASLPKEVIDSLIRRATEKIEEQP
jgi:transcriptional regulator with XRE-family HTH domain